ncbi:hypothetical protein CRV02_13360 [Arcobacter sp. CECT 8989]|uniref:hypothetical protein n=1 Tax=Arcobacter sp. CECT 8989 TaxID=2044509 RepID=UPI00100AA5A9|nr:hypothetical protein [Arcobacter sp. CECT 8989]RXJ98475.1 hypothetical protein CRV02_13360 [Arcobacter sp. CECT 8989]
MNKKVVFAALVLISLIIYYVNYEDEVKDYIKVLLESPYLIFTYNSLIGIVFLLHALFVKNNDSFDFKVLNADIPIIDAALNFTTYGAVGSTALSLLKGLYLQNVFNITYFKYFQTYDLSVMFIVCLFLLWFSLTRVYKAAVEVLFYTTK